MNEQVSIVMSRSGAHLWPGGVLTRNLSVGVNMS
jgi:hypothetical protein